MQKKNKPNLSGVSIHLNNFKSELNDANNKKKKKKKKKIEGLSSFQIIRVLLKYLQERKTMQKV